MRESLVRQNKLKQNLASFIHVWMDLQRGHLHFRRTPKTPISKIGTKRLNFNSALHGKGIVREDNTTADFETNIDRKRSTNFKGGKS